MLNCDEHDSMLVCWSAAHTAVASGQVHRAPGGV